MPRIFIGSTDTNSIMLLASVRALLLLCVIPVLTGEAGLTRRAVTCEAGWIQRGATCYKLVNDISASWPDAQVYCGALGGVLAAPKDKGEGDFVRQLAMNHTLICPWIGIFDVNGEGRWISSATKKPTGYVDWGTGEPNNNGGRKENCVCVYPPLSYRWNDAPCHESLEFICQKTPR